MAGEAQVDRFHIELEVASEMAGESAESENLFPAAVWSLELDVSMEQVRRFRDGSIGWLVRFESVSETLSVQGGAPVPLDGGLAGRVVELRTFEDGEVLDVDHGSHIAGRGRGGDVLDVLFPILSPAPPRVRAGQAAHRRMIWPFRIGSAVRWDNAVQAEWTQVETRKTKQGAVHVLHYQGPWRLKGSDRRVQPLLLFNAEGQVEGTIEVSGRNGALLQHQFEWTRVVGVREAEQAPMAQRQRYVGTLKRVEP